MTDSSYFKMFKLLKYFKFTVKFNLLQVFQLKMNIFRYQHKNIWKVYIMFQNFYEGYASNRPEDNRTNGVHCSFQLFGFCGYGLRGRSSEWALYISWENILKCKVSLTNKGSNKKQNLNKHAKNTPHPVSLLYTHRLLPKRPPLLHWWFRCRQLMNHSFEKHELG